jgi:hypothetical protein
VCASQKNVDLELDPDSFTSPINYCIMLRTVILALALSVAVAFVPAAPRNMPRAAPLAATKPDSEGPGPMAFAPHAAAAAIAISLQLGAVMPAMAAGKVEANPQLALPSYGQYDSKALLAGKDAAKLQLKAAEIDISKTQAAEAAAAKKAAVEAGKKAREASSKAEREAITSANTAKAADKNSNIKAAKDAKESAKAAAKQASKDAAAEKVTRPPYFACADHIMLRIFTLTHERNANTLSTIAFVRPQLPSCPFTRSGLVV